MDVLVYEDFFFFFFFILKHLFTYFSDLIGYFDVD